jgi:hypothetical protein
LANGTTYTFTVTATNAIGTSPASAASNQVTPSNVTAPLAPTAVTATAGAGSATISWTPPNNGGSPITSYTVTPYVGSTAQTATTVTGSPPASSATITGLLSGTAYTFTVTATNAIGTGPASPPSNSVTPTAQTVPAAPAGVVATAGISNVTVSWTAPGNGGSAITSYTVTPYIGSTAQTPTTVNGSPPATSVALSGLTNGTTYTFAVTATNAVGTSVASAASNLATPEPSAPNCPCSILGSSTPAVVDSGDTNAVNVGVRFTVDSSGYINGIRFYKSAANTGTHVGSLWGADGTLLARATFSGETASGWQQVYFSNPVQVTPGTIYVASYLTPSGHYSVTTNAFGSSVNAPPLYGVANSTAANGVFNYGSTASFPTSSFNAGNYWVDVIFSQASIVAPLAPSGVTAVAGVSAASVSWTAPSSGGSPITSYSVTPYIGATAQTPTTVTGSPAVTSTTVSGLANGTTYTFVVTATNSAGSSPASSPSNLATPEASAPTCPCSIFGSATPAVADAGDGSSVNLGVAFTSDTNGFIRGIRFYKSAANTGTHIGSLWTASGTLLAQATFSNETASGWQQVLFQTPVAITAGVTYVASYLAPNGHYSVTANGLGSGANAPPLYALANSTTANGLYTYGGAPVMPTNTYNATNYWVDAVFSQT